MRRKCNTNSPGAVRLPLALTLCLFICAARTARAQDVVLQPSPPTICEPKLLLFYDDFERGAGNWSISNFGPAAAFDWALTSTPLPFARPGTAWFTGDLAAAGCLIGSDSASNTLMSPVIALPFDAGATRLAFTHLLGSEGQFDGGTISIRVNGRFWVGIPRTAFLFNGYNGKLRTTAQGNTNPLQGQEAWTGSGGVWGTSIVDLSGFAVPGDTVQFRFDFGRNACNGVTGWYVDDVMVYHCQDCDGSGGSDEDEITFTASSAVLGNIGNGVSQSFNVIGPPRADGPVTVYLTAHGDFAAASEFIDVFLNGTLMGRVLDVGGGLCPVTPDTQAIVIPEATFDANVPLGGNANFSLMTPGTVNATACGTPGTSYVTISLRYAPERGCSGGADTACANGISDACECDCDNDNVPDACEITQSPNADCDANGILDVCETPPANEIYLAADFNAGLPANWFLDGNFQLNSSCAAAAGCASGQVAYAGNTATCTYAESETGALIAPAVMAPPTATGVTLRYCSRLQTRNGLDFAFVKVNGVDVSLESGGTGAWVQKQIDLSAFIGSTIQLTFVFAASDTVMGGSFLGWQIDNVELEITGQGDGDNDGVRDGCDNCPALSNANQADTDADGVGNICDNCPTVANPTQANSDGDSFADACDNCPLVTNADQADGDLDGVGNVCDNCPTDSNASQTDTDSDGRGNVCDNCPTLSNSTQTDTDSDGIGNTCDNCPFTSNTNQQDTDLDLIGNVCDNCINTANNNQADFDLDTFGDVCDNCPNNANLNQANADGDSRGDICDNCPSVSNSSQGDSDLDTIGDACDNCPTTGNFNQLDSDGDGRGNACDNCPNVANASQTDSDGDGLGNSCDNCPFIANLNQLDGDGDFAGDACDNCLGLSNPTQADSDVDGKGDACDNCPFAANPTQTDGDGDGRGNLCDNCPVLANPDQADGDGDAIGNLCDNCPTGFNFDQADPDGDGIGNPCDRCPVNADPAQTDGDGDGIGDACDKCPNGGTTGSGTPITISGGIYDEFHPVILTGEPFLPGDQFSVTGGTPPYTFKWAVQSPQGMGSFSDPNSATPTFQSQTPGEYVIRVTAMDSVGCEGSTQFTVSVTSSAVFSTVPVDVGDAASSCGLCGPTGAVTLFTLVAGLLTIRGVKRRD